MTLWNWAGNQILVDVAAGLVAATWVWGVAVALRNLLPASFVLRRNAPLLGGQEEGTE